MSPEPAETIQLPPRFAHIKKNLIAGRERAVAASWERLLSRLRSEVERIASTGSSTIPTIDFEKIDDPKLAGGFLQSFGETGAAIVRSVLPKSLVADWRHEMTTYLSSNPKATSLPTGNPHLVAAYWTPAQVKSRAHANIIAAQKFAMSMWHSSDQDAPVSGNFPVVYADRLRIRTSSISKSPPDANVDGGSVERWEPDGYGRAGTYQKIWDGKWEDYDPWESSTRLRVTSDLYNGAGACSMFRMFQGWLSLSRIDRCEGALLLCPMIRLSTAYFLLRPFFSPLKSASEAGSDFLRAENWRLDDIQSSIIHGALPSYRQELSDVLHPHLELSRSMVPVPSLEPGDYILWHCDMIYSTDADKGSALDAAVLYMPACPLTQTNALYLARQRKAFLLGLPSPDFGGGKGESSHIGRPGVLEVNDVGGEDGLRAMGLLPWDEEQTESEGEKGVLRMANGILFPDIYEMV